MMIEVIGGFPVSECFLLVVVLVMTTTENGNHYWYKLFLLPIVSFVGMNASVKLRFVLMVDLRRRQHSCNFVYTVYAETGNRNS